MIELLISQNIVEYSSSGQEFLKQEFKDVQN